MIGKTIVFEHRDANVLDSYKENPIKTGIVVDAWVEINGYYRKGGDFLSGGAAKGSTSSQRMYKVEYYSDYDKKTSYINIKDSDFLYIVKESAQQ